MQIVVKATKFCSLRCSYCYEYANLSDKARMGVETLAALYAWANEIRTSKIEFVWHGGEPLLLGSRYYEEARALQLQALPDRKVLNSCQTNAATISEAMLEFLAQGQFFTGLGISFDPVQSQRIDMQGRPTVAIVERNMGRLKSRGVAFGAISVLTRQTYPFIEAVYDYFDVRGIDSRLLPYYLESNQYQSILHRLNAEMIADAWIRVFKRWAESSSSTPMDPIPEMIEYAYRFINQKPFERTYLKIADESAIIVNTNGDVFGTYANYEPTLAYGNIKTNSFEDVMNSDARREACLASERRVELYCGNCLYRGYCPGHYVAEATALIVRELQDGECPVKLFLRRAIPLLEQAGPLGQP